jgi:hypothetical protein
VGATYGEEEATLLSFENIIILIHLIALNRGYDPYYLTIIVHWKFTILKKKI